MSAAEHIFAVRLANRVLDRADQFGAIDPDDDIVVLARQLLRSHEVLTKIAPSVCSHLCPSVKKTGEHWTHSAECQAVRFRIGASS